MQVAQEYLGEVDERITRMATALPGGLNLRGGTCGILLGALGAVGLQCGSVKRNERQLCGKLGLRVYDFFERLTRDKYGTVNCRDISGFDFTKPEEARAYIGSAAQNRCAVLLADTVRFTLLLLDDPNLEQSGSVESVSAPRRSDAPEETDAEGL